MINNVDKDSFNRYLKDNLKGDLELEQIIQKNISNRGNEKLVIERRMLNSIKRTFKRARFDKEEMKHHKSLPNFRQICENVGLGDLGYVTIQRMGSHAIHGTWYDLLTNYIKFKDGEFSLRDNIDSKPQENYFTQINILLIEALKE